MSDSVTITKKEPKTDTRRSRAYAQAGVALRQAHREEFNQYYAQACKDLGLPYKVRKSKAEREAEAEEKRLEKAKARVANLVEKYGEDILPFPETEDASPV